MLGFSEAVYYKPDNVTPPVSMTPPRDGPAKSHLGPQSDVHRRCANHDLEIALLRDPGINPVIPELESVPVEIEPKCLGLSTLQRNLGEISEFFKGTRQAAQHVVDVKLDGFGAG
jgi:hypothetical protein